MTSVMALPTLILRVQKGGEFVTPGPDFLWYCEGHNKFRNYGIEIYAGVDAYSRRILWVYVGIRQSIILFLLILFHLCSQFPSEIPSYFTCSSRPFYPITGINHHTYCCPGCNLRRNKKLVTLCLCWTPLTIDQGSPTLTPVKKGYGKKGKAIKKEIKQEIKQEVKSEPANTVKSIGKRPRSIS